MKIVVIGGGGLIGAKLVGQLRQLGHETLAASPRSGIDAVTGEGLAAALAGAQVVVDVANSPSFESAAVLKFFETATRNLLAEGERAGVRHHVALSVVGSDRLPDSGYLRAKLAQENLIRRSTVPYSILRATQFFEFIGSIAEASAVGNEIHVSHALIQPILSDDVVEALVNRAVAAPLNGIMEVAGPDRFRIDDLVRRVMLAKADTREVVTDAEAPYFGTKLKDRSLTADDDALIGSTHFEDWLGRSA